MSDVMAAMVLPKQTWLLSRLSQDHQKSRNIRTLGMFISTWSERQLIALGAGTNI